MEPLLMTAIVLTGLLLMLIGYRLLQNRCAHCGARNPWSATHCQFCGRSYHT